MTTNSVQSNRAAKPAKAYKGMAMEGMIARWYNKNARRDSAFLALVERVSKVLPAGSRILEVAPGPGFLSIELAKRKYDMTGLDISKTFVEIGLENAREAGVSVDFRLGNASEMPLESKTFDFIVCTAAFKNFSEPVEAIQEMYRVLKPGGTALIVDLRRDASREGIEQEVKSMHLNWINSLFTQVTFDQLLLKNAYTKQEMQAMVAQTEFVKCEIREDAIGMEIWLNKYKLSSS